MNEYSDCPFIVCDCCWKGSTELVTTIHNLDNLMIVGGIMRLYEAPDAFTKSGATFEYAKIIRRC